MSHMHAFDPKAFRRQRLVWMLALMLPSFIVDAVLLYRAAALHPVALTADGRLDIWGLLLLLAVNAVLLKSEALFFYFQLRWQRRRSHVYKMGNELIYFKRRLLLRDLDYGYTYFTEYHIRKVKEMHRRSHGAFVLHGDIEALYLQEDGISPHHSRMVHRLVIPAYFEGLDAVWEKLEALRGDNHLRV